MQDSNANLNFSNYGLIDNFTETKAHLNMDYFC